MSQVSLQFEGENYRQLIALQYRLGLQSPGMVITVAMWLMEKAIDEQAAGGDVVFVDKGGGVTRLPSIKGVAATAQAEHDKKRC